MSVSTIHTERLILAIATPDSVRAALAGPDALAKSLGASIATDWPHEYLDRKALEYFLARADSVDGANGWWLRFVLLREACGSCLLIGSAGYKGPPSAQGAVEIGYGVVASQRRNGYATEVARALASHALSHPSVSMVTASTLAHLHDSIRVLEKCGFRYSDTSSGGLVHHYVAKCVTPASDQAKLDSLPNTRVSRTLQQCHDVGG